MASGTAEREAALDLVDKACRRGFHPNTLAADQTYDTRHCVGELRQRRVTPHVAQNNSGRRSAIDRRTTRYAGYGVSQHFRTRVGGDLRLGEDDRWLPTGALPWSGADSAGWTPGRR